MDLFLPVGVLHENQVSAIEGGVRDTGEVQAPGQAKEVGELSLCGCLALLRVGQQVVAVPVDGLAERRWLIRPVWQSRGRPPVRRRPRVSVRGKANRRGAFGISSGAS